MDRLDPVGKGDHDVLVFQLYVAKEKTNQMRQYYDMNKEGFNFMRQIFNDVD